MIKYILIFFFLSSIYSYAGTQTLPPTAIDTSSGFSSCVITSVDEDPDSSNGDWCVASGNNTDTILRVDFDTPTNPPQDGAGLQEIRVLLRPFDSGQTGDPTVAVDIYNAGVLDANTSCTSETITNDGGDQIISCTWDSTDLDVNDGSTVQAHIHCTKTGGSPTVRNTCDHGAVEWNANTEAATSRHSYIISNNIISNIDIIGVN